jgi:hypothetical protein
MEAERTLALKEQSPMRAMDYQSEGLGSFLGIIFCLPLSRNGAILILTEPHKAQIRNHWREYENMISYLSEYEDK